MDMARTTIGIILALLTGIWYSWWFQPLGHNQLSRIDMQYAMAVEGRMNIDSLRSNTQDVAYYQGKYYSDKAPGPTYLGIPAYAASLAMEHALGIQPASRLGISFSLWWVTLSTSVLLAMLGTLATWMVLLRFCTRPRTAAIVTMACWLGTIALPYGTMFMSHTSTIGLVSIALAAALLPPGRQMKTHSSVIVWWKGARAIGLVSVFLLLCWTAARVAGVAVSIRFFTLYISMLALSMGILLTAGTWTMLHEYGGTAETMRRSTVFGIAVALAILGEYMAVFPAAALWIVYARRSYGPALRSAWIAAVLLLLLPLTNWLCFGHPMQLGYGLNSFAWMDRGFYGVTPIPRLDNLILLLLSPSKGLFFWSPFLALALPGWAELYRRNRMLCITTLAAAITVVLAIAATDNANGGAAVGPRYLAPIIALLAIPAALGYEIVPRWGGTLVTISILLQAVATAVDPMPTKYILVPLVTHHLPALLRGSVLPNIGTLFGLQPFFGMLPLLGCSVMLMWAALRGAGRMRKTVAIAK